MGMVTYISPRGHKRVDDVVEEVKSKLNEVDIKLSEVDEVVAALNEELTITDQDINDVISMIKNI